MSAAGTRASERGAAARPRLLLVGRDGPLHRALELGLVDAGFAVFSVTGGHDALARSQQEPPAVVLAAAKLPDMDGAELRRRISQSEQLRGTPFVLMGDGRADEPALGEDGLVKPTALRELVARIKILLPDDAEPAPEPEEPPAAAAPSTPVQEVTLPGELRPGHGGPPRIVRFPLPDRKPPTSMHIAKTATFDLPINPSSGPTPPAQLISEEVTAPSELPPPAVAPTPPWHAPDEAGPERSRKARSSAVRVAAVVLVVAGAVWGMWRMRDGKAGPSDAAASPPAAAAVPGAAGPAAPAGPPAPPSTPMPARLVSPPPAPKR